MPRRQAFGKKLEQELSKGTSLPRAMESAAAAGRVTKPSKPSRKPSRIPLVRDVKQIAEYYSKRPQMKRSISHQKGLQKKFQRRINSFPSNG